MNNQEIHALLHYVVRRAVSVCMRMSRSFTLSKRVNNSNCF